MPGALQEPVDTLDSMLAPLGIELRRSDKQFVHAKRVATKIPNKFVRIDDVALRFRHFLGLAALADVRDHALVKQPQKRLIEIDDSNVVQKHCEEPRVKEMQNRVLHATDVEIDREPLLAFCGEQLVFVVR